MIAQLRGHVLHQDRSGVVLDVQGVGYAVQTSGRTGSMLGHDGGEVVLLTEMQVREDSMTLFGFVDVAERDAFRLLITVQGVGAKAAMSILSVLSPLVGVVREPADEWTASSSCRLPARKSETIPVVTV